MISRSSHPRFEREPRAALKLTINGTPLFERPLAGKEISPFVEGFDAGYESPSSHLRSFDDSAEVAAYDAGLSFGQAARRYKR